MEKMRACGNERERRASCFVKMTNKTYLHKVSMYQLCAEGGVSNDFRVSEQIQVRRDGVVVNIEDIVWEPRDPIKANRTKVRQIAKFGMIVYYKLLSII